MTDLAIHPATEQQIIAFTAAPSHALILVGPSGSGKRALALKIATTVLDIASLDDYPYALQLTPDTDSIGIEEIRKLDTFLSLKVPGTQTYKRIVLIEQADRLTLEAQNALLKNLEEPPIDTLVILTVSQRSDLLPTIRSRAQSIVVGQPELQSLQVLFSGTETSLFQRAYALSGGRPGLLNALLNEQDHPLQEAVIYARQLLSQSLYDRLIAVDTLAKKPALARDVTLILQHMAHISLQTASGKTIKRWQTILRASYLAHEGLAKNGQAKLVLTNLMLNL